MRQVAKIKNYSVYLTNDKMNPYTIKKRWLIPGEYGLRERTKTLDKFANLQSCLLYIADLIDE